MIPALHQVMQVIAELPPRCREVFILCRIDGLDHQQVVERLGISKSTVVSQMVKARYRTVLSSFVWPSRS